MSGNFCKNSFQNIFPRRLIRSTLYALTCLSDYLSEDNYNVFDTFIFAVFTLSIRTPLTAYHIHNKNLKKKQQKKQKQKKKTKKTSIFITFMCVHILSWMSGKQCRLLSDAAFCGVLSGSPLFAYSCLSQYLR